MDYLGEGRWLHLNSGLNTVQQDPASLSSVHSHIVSILMYIFRNNGHREEGVCQGRETVTDEVVQKSTLTSEGVECHHWVNSSWELTRTEIGISHLHNNMLTHAL